MWQFLAQVAPEGTDWLNSLGPFVAFGILAMGVILDLRANNKQKDADLKAVNHELVELQKQVLPVLTEAISTLSENTKALERRRER